MVASCTFLLQKAFSRRCFRQAAVLYRNQDWKRAQTHIEHALGRQAYTVGESDVAVEHFVRLLKGDQGDFLDDFVLAFEASCSLACVCKGGRS